MTSLAVVARQEQLLADLRQLPGLESWYDARYINGFGVAQPAEGAALAQWNDLSGKGRHLVQPTAGNKPLFRGLRNLENPPLRALTAGSSLSTDGVWTMSALTDSVTVWAHVNGAAAWSVALDVFATASSPNGSGGNIAPNVGWTVSSTYYAEDRVTSVLNSTGFAANGHAGAAGLPNTWQRAYYSYFGGPNVKWIKFIFGNDPLGTYTVAGTKIRNIDLQMGATSPSNRIPFVPVAGGPSVVFDGVDDYMATAASLGLTTPATAYVICNYAGLNAAASNNQCWFGCTTNGTGGAQRFTFQNVGASVNMYAAFGVAQAGIPASTPLIASGWVDGVDGAAVTLSGHALTTSLAGRGVGGLANKLFLSASVAANALFGGIQAAAVFSRLQDEATRRRVEQLMAASATADPVNRIVLARP